MLRWNPDSSISVKAYHAVLISGSLLPHPTDRICWFYRPPNIDLPTPITVRILSLPSILHSPFPFYTWLCSTVRVEMGALFNESIHNSLPSGGFCMGGFRQYMWYPLSQPSQNSNWSYNTKNCHDQGITSHSFYLKLVSIKPRQTTSVW